MWLGQREGENKRLRSRCEGWKRFLFSLGDHCQYLDFEQNGELLQGFEQKSDKI